MIFPILVPCKKMQKIMADAAVNDSNTTGAVSVLYLRMKNAALGRNLLYDDISSSER
jgi:hypothetical protein